MEKDLTPSNQKIVKETVHDLISKQELPATAQNLIITIPRTSAIYFKPKIHKPNNPGRPIVSAYSCPTEPISQYLTKLCHLLLNRSYHISGNTNHALKTFCDFNFPGQNKLIFTMDITSLYIVIPNYEGLLALKYFFDQRANKQRSTETLIRLTELVLTLNCFSFSDNYYKQINGVAMGTKMGPSYANLFVGFIEQQFFDKFDGTKPELYRRYIDDCFGATSCSRQEPGEMRQSQPPGESQAEHSAYDEKYVSCKHKISQLKQTSHWMKPICLFASLKPLTFNVVIPGKIFEIVTPRISALPTVSDSQPSTERRRKTCFFLLKSITMTMHLSALSCIF